MVCMWGTLCMWLMRCMRDLTVLCCAVLCWAGLCNVRLLCQAMLRCAIQRQLHPARSRCALNLKAGYDSACRSSVKRSSRGCTTPRRMFLLRPRTCWRACSLWYLTTASLSSRLGPCPIHFTLIFVFYLACFACVIPNTKCAYSTYLRFHFCMFAFPGPIKLMTAWGAWENSYMHVCQDRQ